MATTNNFLNALNNTDAKKSVSVTENGAIGYSRTSSHLTDFFFKVGSMRQAEWTVDRIQTEFAEVYAEDKQRAFELMFFVRDCRGGQGERKVFNAIFGWIIKNDPQSAISLLPLIPEYGSWKTFFDLTPYFLSASKDVLEAAKSLFIKQWDEDIDKMEAEQPISLMPKWAPSCNASSVVTKGHAYFWRHVLGISEREYRKTIASLRDYLKVIEVKISANKWGEIDYNAVPSRAGVIYRNSFLRHDGDRRRQWLADLKKPESGAKINTAVLDVPTIIHNYINYNHEETVSCPQGYTWGFKNKEEDTTLEAAWSDLVVKGQLKKSVPSFIPILDCSGSMYSSCAEKSSLTAIDVAMGLALYFANINIDPWKGNIIEFGSEPKFYKVPIDATLHSQMQIAKKYADCGSTNLEAVFDLILKTAIDNHLKQEEIPSLLIISDLEFNEACEKPDERLFKVIADKYAVYGYKLPRFIFWGVNSRSSTIPVIENDLGVILVSGFNQSLVKMVMSGKLDLYDVLIEQLDAPRYDLIRNALN